MNAWAAVLTVGLSLLASALCEWATPLALLIVKISTCALPPFERVPRLEEWTRHVQDISDSGQPIAALGWACWCPIAAIRVARACGALTVEEFAAGIGGALSGSAVVAGAVAVVAHGHAVASPIALFGLGIGLLASGVRMLLHSRSTAAAIGLFGLGTGWLAGGIAVFARGPDAGHNGMMGFGLGICLLVLGIGTLSGRRTTAKWLGPFALGFITVAVGICMLLVGITALAIETSVLGGYAFLTLGTLTFAAGIGTLAYRREGERWLPNAGQRGSVNS